MSDAAHGEAAAPAEGAHAPAKQSLAKLLIPVVAGLAVGAGAATGAFLFLGKSDSSAAHGEASDAEHADAEAGDGKASDEHGDEHGAHGDSAGEDADARAHGEGEGRADAHADAEHAEAEGAHGDSGHGGDAHGESPEAEASHGGGHADGRGGGGASEHASSGGGRSGGSSHGGGHGSGETPDETSKGPIWKLEPVVTNLVTDGAPVLLKMTIELGFGSESARDAAMEHGSVVRDSVLTLVSSRRVADLTSFEGKVLLKEDLRLRINHVLDGPRVESVLLTEFLVQ
jgi:flagellar basal body-associated protein FliL